jgi:hypothetical protein
MDTVPVRSAVDDAMLRLLEAVAETQKRNTGAMQQPRCDVDLLRAAPPSRAQASLLDVQRAP